MTEEGNEYQLSPETEALSIELRNDQDGTDGLIRPSITFIR